MDESTISSNIILCLARYNKSYKTMKRRNLGFMPLYVPHTYMYEQVLIYDN